MLRARSSQIISIFQIASVYVAKPTDRLALVVVLTTLQGFLIRIYTARRSNSYQRNH